MNTNTDNPPAFPIVFTARVHSQGMTLRDWFAGQALEIVSFEPTSGITRSDAEIARAAYGLADALLLARQQKD